MLYAKAIGVSNFMMMEFGTQLTLFHTIFKKLCIYAKLETAATCTSSSTEINGKSSLPLMGCRQKAVKWTIEGKYKCHKHSHMFAQRLSAGSEVS